MKTARDSRGSGFSLIELIVVISIIVLVMTLLVPAFSTLGRAAKLNTAINGVVDELNLARQTALARNRTVEVRFYHLTDLVNPKVAYRAVKTMVADESGAYYLPLGAMRTLPVGIVALEDKKFSSLLAVTNYDSQAVSTWFEDLPNALHTPYVPIRFRPTGGVDLSGNYTPASGGATSDNWFLTVKNEQDPAFPDRPANNYGTIQLDPVTGRTRLFRP